MTRGGEAVEQEIRATLAGTTLADARIVPVSTVTGNGIDELREHLFEADPSCRRSAARADAFGSRSIAPSRCRAPAPW